MIIPKKFSRTYLKILLFGFILSIFQPVSGQTTTSSYRTKVETKNGKTPLSPMDYYKIPELSDLEITKDGNWAVYSLSMVDTAKNKRIKHLWLEDLIQKQSIQLSFGNESESNPKFSPNGKYIAYQSEKDSEIGPQIYLLDRRGGEGKKITTIKGDIEDYDWSPDSKKLVLIIKDPEPKPKNTAKTLDPIVLDRYHFKQDIQGFLGNLHSHIFLLTLEGSKLDSITKGKSDEKDPRWSPDGSKIVFVSNKSEDPDRNSNTDIFTIQARVGGEIKQLTHWSGSDDSPRWSPDGKSIAYLQSTGSGAFIMYDQQKSLYIMDSEGNNRQALLPSLNRTVSEPTWSKDGTTIGFTVVDDRKLYLSEFKLANRKLTKYEGYENSFRELQAGNNHDWYGVLSQPNEPDEIYESLNGIFKRITFHQSVWSKNTELAVEKGFTSISKDGTKISSILYTSPSLLGKKNLPLILFIHGGPVAQDDYEFDFTRQVLAEAGYLVIAVNYRGSDGRGLDFTKSIAGDWGNKEVSDLLGAVDTLVKQGLADPQRLGIGGWSYGGILTNYTIATDTRFKAACSGASSSLQLSMYGIDQYVLQYDNELGPPWKNPEKWIQLSYPFFHADKIKTPTLFMASEKDFNVPSVGAEQMFQAFKSIGIPAQLVIYPNQYHGITTPTYIVDQLNRYILWYDKYLKN